ncbi:ABC transporter substrate-binding protein [[Clostridium] polysaccharolyticum]|uniref:Peptide/nickel transport system substrate-binding protein n=1 Tax=[Clostridium] polysaccharolyticum TaxID=29364 RepID=A0A1H9ZCF2_9FIRM|nr:ABC transporter substrate-binding protein [[Clostridium] polysaccharolyticum]SES78506.1 peptide/nickel transport system substrate-binding protein [[Clostridium] polysaccharolyticum]
MKKQKFIFLTLALVMSIALCACGGDKKKTENADSSSVVVGITQDLDSLDPHKAVAAGTHEVLFNVFEGLVKPDEKGNLNPAVASEYKVNEKGTEYTFTLRDGVFFHNGKEVTVNDVVYSMKRAGGLLEEESSDININSAIQKNVKTIEAVDDGTVAVTLKEPDTEFLAYLTESDCAIIPADYKEQNKAPIGTGPFKFVSYAPLKSFVMEKYEEYWNKEKMPHIKETVFKICSNTDTAFLELQSGGIDIFPYLTEEQSNQLSKDKFKVEIGNMNLVQGLFLNNKKAPFDNPHVREALNYAIDRQAVIDMVAGGNGTVIGSNMFPGLSKYYNQEEASRYTRQPDKVKEQLKLAGYEDGLSFTITVPSNYQYHVDTAQVIVEQLKEFGINAEINLVDWSTWLSDVYTNRDYQATVIGLDGNLSPKDLMERYVSTADNNFVNYSSEAYDKLLAKAVSVTEQKEKEISYKKLQSILAEDSASVYLQDPALLVAVNKNIEGYQFYPVYVQDMSSIQFAAK